MSQFVLVAPCVCFSICRLWHWARAGPIVTEDLQLLFLFSLPVCCVLFRGLTLQLYLGCLSQQHTTNYWVLPSLVSCFHRRVQSVCIDLYYQWLLMYLDTFLLDFVLSVCPTFSVSFHFSFLMRPCFFPHNSLCPLLVWEHILTGYSFSDPPL